MRSRLWAVAAIRYRFLTPGTSPISLRAARLLQHRARPSLGNRELLLQVRGRRTLRRRAHQFFDATCFSIWLSRDRSATNCFSRRFSSSSSESRFASSDFIPPY